jgi:D-alanyl-D-alanine carboxypeptidase
VDGEKRDLNEGETISVNNLLQLMLVKSSNDAAYALADHAKTKNIDLIAAMNAKAAELGMLNTRFADPAGLDDTGYSTAADMVKAVRYALRYSAIWNFSREKTATVLSADGKFSHEVASTNQLLGVLSDIVGGKTGYTDGALGCMILVVDIPAADDKIVSIILGSRERFTDMEKLVNWAKTAYRWN